MQAVIFDLDGTLVDSAEGICLTLNKVAAQQGKPPIDTSLVRGLVSRGALELVGTALGSGGTPQAAQDLQTFRALYAQYRSSPAELYPGVAKGIQTLAKSGLALGICTNKPQHLTLGVLRDVGLAPYFSAIIGGDAVPCPKPSPQHVQAVAEGLAVPLDACCLVGDSEVDSQAAAAAGIPFYFVRYGYALGGEIHCRAASDHFPKIIAQIMADQN